MKVTDIAELSARRSRLAAERDKCYEHQQVGVWREVVAALEDCIARVDVAIMWVEGRTTPIIKE